MQGSDEARLFLRRLKDGQKKLAFELKKMRLDRGFNDSTIIKRANDRIAFWLFEGEELWKVTRAATAKTLNALRAFSKNWQKLTNKPQEEEEHEEPSVITYVRKLTDNI